ncbi:Ger(x)C family spore germination protein [Gorillibacterium massiliense]|uniref:Ger(x)C family spore germination protein n=1 Tax=Gorillibacterium massiliense TaxID=1280390 RepID=UPI0004B7E889|nr:Ger(x)C family spore germination protein [Gorillibacterium massiliense]
MKPIGRLMKTFVGLCVLLSTAGCWNARELNELSVALAMGIDKDGDGQYIVSFQSVDPTQMSYRKTVERSPTILYSEKASTIFEAIRKMSTKVSRRIYVAHLRLIVFSEEVARDGLKAPLDLLFRDHEVRPDFFITIVRGKHKARDVMGFVAPTEVLPAMDMYKSLKVSEAAWAPTVAVNVKDFLEMLVKEGQDPILTGMTFIGDLKKGLRKSNVAQPLSIAEYKYMGIGVMEQDRLVGWLNEDESKVYNYITNNITSTIGKVKCPHGEHEIALEITHAHVKMVPSIKDDKPSMKLKVTIDANVGEAGCNIDLSKEATLVELQEAGKEVVRKLFTGSIRKVQKYGPDIFGFGEAFHRKYPSTWHKWKDTWQERFKTMPVEIETDYHIRYIGRIIDPFGPEKE